MVSRTGRSPSRGWSFLLLLIGVSSTGCSLFSGTEISHVKSSVQKPSNVAFYVAVSDRGQPVTDLLSENFKIFENDQPLDPEQVRLTLLDREPVSAHHTLLLLDLSSSESSSRRKLVSAVESFVSSIREQQSMSLFAFDGRKHITPLAEFSQRKSGSRAALRTLSNYRARDSSRNLYGAVVQAVNKLDAKLKSFSDPVRVGTLVVFSEGPDMAARVGEDTMFEALDEAPYDVFTIGVGAQHNSWLEEVGTSGVTIANSESELDVAFDEAASTLRKAYQRYYLVAYCSPSRAGQRRARLEVSFTTVDGDERHGDLERDFDATGFFGGCSPKTQPRFLKGTIEPDADPESSSQASSPKARASGSNGKGPQVTPVLEVPEQPETEEEQIVPPPDTPGYE